MNRNEYLALRVQNIEDITGALQEMCDEQHVSLLVTVGTDVGGIVIDLGYGGLRLRRQFSDKELTYSIDPLYNVRTLVKNDIIKLKVAAGKMAYGEIDENLCAHCSLPDECKGTTMGHTGTIRYCSDSGLCEDAYMNYLAVEEEE